MGDPLPPRGYALYHNQSKQPTDRDNKCRWPNDGLMMAQRFCYLGLYVHGSAAGCSCPVPPPPLGNGMFRSGPTHADSPIDITMFTQPNNAETSPLPPGVASFRSGPSHIRAFLDSCKFTAEPSLLVTPLGNRPTKYPLPAINKKMVTVLPNAQHGEVLSSQPGHTCAHTAQCEHIPCEPHGHMTNSPFGPNTVRRPGSISNEIPISTRDHGNSIPLAHYKSSPNFGSPGSEHQIHATSSDQLCIQCDAKFHRKQM